ncbi:hypothetical protein KC19_5G134200 [Ceratodon purpureus]|uniref:Uncharacterized protein n=1 Tax=Ceratodon purpureus TaxID=3225 RepID=A0A8T0I3C8_CERPU|nr:hypothetical protein KC19_5G134200 [Ceratodon purpureus]
MEAIIQRSASSLSYPHKYHCLAEITEITATVTRSCFTNASVSTTRTIYGLSYQHTVSRGFAGRLHTIKQFLSTRIETYFLTLSYTTSEI